MTGNSRNRRRPTTPRPGRAKSLSRAGSGDPRERSPGRGPRPGRPRAKRRYSQNFLVDKGICNQIADFVRATKADTVLEIGPGTGALTRPLLAQAKTLHAVEVDRELFAALKVEFAEEPNLVLHQTDILKRRLSDFVPTGPVLVAGNLPYNITTDLLFWLLEERERVRRAVVMMQHEVARRLTAPPGTRESGAVTLALQYRCEADMLMDIPPSAFRPRPRVVSTVVALRFRKDTVVHPRDERLFFRIIRASFGQRRKTLVNALTGALDIDRDTIQAVVQQAGLDPKVRGERLTLEDFEKLSDLMSETQT